jgi:hemerythrin-like domain-containing protein
MEALHIIGEEHQSLAAILHAIRFMLREIAAGKLEADIKLFQAMVHYLDAYAEKRHHPKEDLLFRRLPQRTGEGAEALAKLGLQHAAAPQRMAALEGALARRPTAAGSRNLPRLSISTPSFTGST